jgi:uncharacterized protein HemY
VYFSEQQYEKARIALEAAARFNASEPKVHYQLSQVYARLGNEAGARAEQQLYLEAQKKAEERIRPVERRPF